MNRIKGWGVTTVFFCILLAFQTSEADQVGFITPSDGSIGREASANFSSPSSIVADSAGNLYVADSSSSLIRTIVAEREVRTLAGDADRDGGHADGTGAAASFNQPGGIATDSTGNLYVADTANDIIRKITPAGVVTTLAGNAEQKEGHADGTGAAARFYKPGGIAIDSADNIYVADSGNNLIRKITPAGVVMTLAGTAGMKGHADGTGATASFNNPIGIAADRAGNIYVADSDNHTIRKITPAGAVTTLAGKAEKMGHADGSGAAASFSHPVGIATDLAGNVYVSDSYAIRKITSTGAVTTLAGSDEQGDPSCGKFNGIGKEARFLKPRGIATDRAGNIYVADDTAIRKITPAVEVTTLAGFYGESGCGNEDEDGE